MQLNGKRFNKKFIYQLIIFTAIVLFIVLDFNRVLKFLGWIYSIFYPLILGGCIAFVLNLLMVTLEHKVFKFIKRRVLRESLSLVLSLIILLTVIVLVILIALPQLIRSFELLSESIPRFFTTMRDNVVTLSQQYPILDDGLKELQKNTANISNALSSFFKNAIPQTITQTYSVASYTVGALASFVIGLMFSFYILLSKKSLGRHGRQLLYTYLPEKKANKILYILHLTAENFNAFIYGQCVEALVLGGMYIVVAFVFRLPYSFMIAVIFAIFSLIPLFGAYIAWGIGTFLIITVNPYQAITFTIIFLVISQIEGNFIYPRIVGNSIGLPGIWVLAAVTVGGNMLGIVGMIIAVPLAALVYTLISENSQKYLKSHTSLVPKILNKPDWSHFDPDTDSFLDHKYEPTNVFSQEEDEDN